MAEIALQLLESSVLSYFHVDVLIKPPINIYRTFELAEPLEPQCLVLVGSRGMLVGKAPATAGHNVLGYLDPQTRYSIKVSCRGKTTPTVEFITSTSAQVSLHVLRQ